jgi:hypothetical protein
MSLNVRSLKNSIAGLKVILLDINRNEILSISPGPHKTSFVQNDNHSYSLSRFEYDYIDDDSDECVISIETTNIYLPDKVQLQEGKTVYVTWGYTNQTVTRKVLIVESITRYLDDKIVLELTCSDINSNQKQMEIKKTVELAEKEASGRASFIDFFNSFYAGKIAIIENSQIIYEDDKDKSKGLQETVPQAQALMDTETGTSFKFDNTGLPFQYAYNMPWPSPMPIGSGKTFVEAVKDVIGEMKNGPWYVSGKDDKIEIHNRNKAFVGPIFKNYVYRGGDGDLLTFLPEVRITDKVEEFEQDGINEETKKKETENTQNPKLTISAKQILQDRFNKNPNYQPTEQEMEVFILEWFELAYEDFKTYGFLTTFASNYLEFTMKEREVDASTQKPGQNWWIEKQGEPEVLLTTTTGIDNTAVRYDLPEIKYRIMIKHIKPGVGGNFTEAMLNKIQAIEQYAYTSRFKILGDPEIEDKKLITITGVAKKFQGRHYINRCKHTITQSGYVVEGETIMQSPTVNKFYTSLGLDTSGKEEILLKDFQYIAHNQKMLNDSTLDNEADLQKNLAQAQFNQNIRDKKILGLGDAEDKVAWLKEAYKAGAFIPDINNNLDEIYYQQLYDFVVNEESEKAFYDLFKNTKKFSGDLIGTDSDNGNKVNIIDELEERNPGTNVRAIYDKRVRDLSTYGQRLKKVNGTNPGKKY